MKKLIVCLLTVMLLTSSVFGMVASALQGQDLGPDSSFQLMYAKLQLEMAEQAKAQAMDRMEKISRIQEDQRAVSAFLNEARLLRTEANNLGESTEMPADMADYMSENSLYYDKTGGDLLLTSDEWDQAINSLENHLNDLGMQTQREMIYVQDYMGQYNSYLSGSNMQINTANQSLTSLARGQSMYGASEAGLAIAALVIGLVLGCALTLGAQRMHRKPDKA